MVGWFYTPIQTGNRLTQDAEKLADILADKREKEMANDRIFIVCKKCGKWRTLMKYYPGTGIYLADVNKTGEFLEDHQDCYGFGGNLGDSPPFEFHTEATFNPIDN